MNKPKACKWDISDIKCCQITSKLWNVFYNLKSISEYKIYACSYCKKRKESIKMTFLGLEY